MQTVRNTESLENEAASLNLPPAGGDATGGRPRLLSSPQFDDDSGPVKTSNFTKGVHKPVETSPPSNKNRKTSSRFLLCADKELAPPAVKLSNCIMAVR